MQHTKRCTVKSETFGARSVTGMISTIAVDRDGDVLLPSGMNAREFNKNPVVMMNHDLAKLPIGKASRLRKTPTGIEAVVTFAKRPEEHPPGAEWVPDTVHALFKQGVLNAFSVGFTVPAGGVRSATKRDRSMFGDSVRQVITDWNMHEFSVVSVPANQDALVTAVSKGILKLDDWMSQALGVPASAFDIREKHVTIERTPEPLRVPIPLRVSG